MAKLKLNDELINKIAKYIGEGLHNTTVCSIVGINESGFYGWINKAKEDEEKKMNASTSVFIRFKQALKAAEAKREAEWVKKIHDDPNWQSKAWLLERRFKERWAKDDITLRLKHGVDEKSAAEIRKVLMSMTDEDVRHALKQATIKEIKDNGQS